MMWSLITEFMAWGIWDRILTRGIQYKSFTRLSFRKLLKLLAKGKINENDRKMREILIDVIQVLLVTLG